MEDRLGRVYIPDHLIEEVAKSQPSVVHVPSNDHQPQYLTTHDTFSLDAVLTLATGRNCVRGSPGWRVGAWSDEACKLATFLTGQTVHDYRDVIGHPRYRELVKKQLWSELNDIIDTLSLDDLPPSFSSSLRTPEDWIAYLNDLAAAHGQYITIYSSVPLAKNSEVG